jgi:hypothetical protein
LVIWLVLGMTIYFFYGRKNSKLAQHPELQATDFEFPSKKPELDLN